MCIWRAFLILKLRENQNLTWYATFMFGLLNSLACLLYFKEQGWHSGLVRSLGA